MRIILEILFELIIWGLIWYCLNIIFGLTHFLIFVSRSKDIIYKAEWRFFWLPFGYRISKKKKGIKIITGRLK